MPAARCRSGPVAARPMHPDLTWAVWSGERARRVESVMDALLPPTSEPPQSLHEAMRYAVLGGKRVRALLAYAAGEFAGADPASSTFRPPRSSWSTPIRSSTTICRAWTTTCCAGASRRAMSHSARRPRCSPAMRCRPGLRSAGRRRHPRPPAGAGAARAGCRLARHGGRTGHRSRLCRAGARRDRTRTHAPTQDRRADPRGGLPRRGLWAAHDCRRERRTGPLRVGHRAGVPGCRRCARRRRHGAEAGQDRGQGRGQRKPTYVTLLGLAAARERSEACAWKRAAALSGFGSGARRLGELADWIVERKH